MTPSRSHRWPRATTADQRWGRICECGNLKTDQALTCNDCAVERRRAPDYWERRTCTRCGEPKSKTGTVCRSCKNVLQTGVSRVGRAQPADHPWRKAEAARLAGVGKAA